jgi:hypothetical protein
MLEYEKLGVRLRDTGCPEPQIPEILKKAESFLPDTVKMLNEWLERGTVAEFSLYDITPEYLRKNKNLADIGIIISYDWLSREGEVAAAALREPLR